MRWPSVGPPGSGGAAGLPSGPADESDLRQQRTDGERDVRRTLGQPAHVPRIPGIAVGDQRLDPVAGPGESILLSRTDPVQHLNLEPVSWDACRGDLIGDLLDQCDVVAAQPETDRPSAAGLEEVDGDGEVT